MQCHDKYRDKNKNKKNKKIMSDIILKQISYS